ncbi:isoquinoline 1-oxidoreductase alpha subunit [Oxalobacteraceae bacterium GrIS 2.11]
MNAFVLDINGEKHKVTLAPDTPLLWALRDTIGLVGTKYGCGIGVCGACTVQIDGVPSRACLTPVSAVGAQKVTTIEGLDPHVTHPLQQAWQELDVPQCGYCQAGQLMTASALLKSNPHPTDAEIDTAMAGNLCRCGTYVRIRAGIHRAAEIGQANEKKSGVKHG